MEVQDFFNENTFTTISVAAVFIPAVMSFLTAAVWRGSCVMLFLFCAGFLAEGIRMAAEKNTWYTLLAFDSYCFAECTVFHWLVSYRTNSLQYISLIRSAAAFTVPVLICTTIVVNFFAITTIREGFNMAYEVAISFLSAREILRLTESESRMITTPYFWLFTGIFFYCFCTFFLMSKLELAVMHKLWNLLHNSVNIVTYALFTTAFWMVYRDRRSRPELMS
jgi:hypothetical protein